MNAIAQGIHEVREGGEELARYRIFGGERVVYGYEVDGGQLLVDVPEKGTEGQLFTVDPCWRNEWTLESFLEDYVAAGEGAGCCPVDPYVEAELVDDALGDEALAELYWRIGRS